MSNPSSLVDPRAVFGDAGDNVSFVDSGNDRALKPGKADSFRLRNTVATNRSGDPSPRSGSRMLRSASANAGRCLSATEANSFLLRKENVATRLRSTASRYTAFGHVPT
jgi:hypothetical protein